MKHIYYILFLLGGLATAQVVISDANFKTYLLSSSATNYISLNSEYLSMAIDSDNSGEISETEADEVRHLVVSGSDIYGGTTFSYGTLDLSIFPNLESFQFYGEADVIDLRQNNVLTSLFVYGTAGVSSGNDLSTVRINKLLIKNGINEVSTQSGVEPFDFNPYNIGEICLDDSQMVLIQNYINQFNVDYGNIGTVSNLTTSCNL